LNRPAREFTGQFCIDDEVLQSAGITDLSCYRHADTREDELLPDGFV
jgi:citronellol/citronellal dehydrogenase